MCGSFSLNAVRTSDSSDAARRRVPEIALRLSRCRASEMANRSYSKTISFRADKQAERRRLGVLMRARRASAEHPGLDVLPLVCGVLAMEVRERGSGEVARAVAGEHERRRRARCASSRAR